MAEGQVAVLADQVTIGMTNHDELEDGDGIVKVEMTGAEMEEIARVLVEVTATAIEMDDVKVAGAQVVRSEVTTGASAARIFVHCH